MVPVRITRAREGGAVRKIRTEFEFVPLTSVQPGAAQVAPEVPGTPAGPQGWGDGPPPVAPGDRPPPPGDDDVPF